MNLQKLLGGMAVPDFTPYEPSFNASPRPPPKEL